MLKRNPWLKHWRMLSKIWKKCVWVTAHLNFNFCNPISKAKQGHKLKFSCPKWAFCHKSSLLFSFLSCPTQLLERGESQHVKYFLGTGNYFFLWVNEGNYKNWGEENDLWTCSNCLDFFPDFNLLQNLEFWAFEGPFRAIKIKRCERRRYNGFVILTDFDLFLYYIFAWNWIPSWTPWGPFINNVRIRGEGRGLTYLVKLIKERKGEGV